jgi:hypothetical protein
MHQVGRSTPQNECEVPFFFLNIQGVFGEKREMEDLCGILNWGFGNLRRGRKEGGEVIRRWRVVEINGRDGLELKVGGHVPCVLS